MTHKESLRNEINTLQKKLGYIGLYILPNELISWSTKMLKEKRNSLNSALQHSDKIEK